MDKNKNKSGECSGLDQQLKDEYEKDALQVLDELAESTVIFPDELIDVEGSYQRLIQRMKAEGIYREEEEYKAVPEAEPREAAAVETFVSEAGKKLQKESEDICMENQKEKRKRGAFRRKLVKVSAFVLAMGLSVFAGSMTSEANRRYFMDSLNMLVGNDIQTQLGNDEMRDKSDMSETRAIREIEEKVGIAVPYFLYRPYEFEYIGYYVDEQVMLANLKYQYEKEWIIYLQMQVADDKMAASIAMHGDAYEIIPLMGEENVTIQIYKVQASTDREPSYLAQWVREDIYYQLSGKMEYGELKQLLTQMYY